MSSDVVIPGDHQNSELYDRITRLDSEQGDMPPTGSLSQEQIDLIAQWIDEGALEFPANECEDGYTYYEDIPQNTCIVFDGSNCFLSQDIQALQDIVELNNLEFENNNPLSLGFQNWINGRLTRLLVGNNSSGGNITLNVLPESIGNLEQLVQLYIDDNELESLPESIGDLSKSLILFLFFIIA